MGLASSADVWRQWCSATLRDAVLNQATGGTGSAPEGAGGGPVLQRQLFIANIEREIAALERGEHSPLINDYLTEAERSGSRPGQGG